jgi:DNA-binding LytR/AlgR family response regulator
MKIVICEDEDIFYKQLAEYINEWAKIKSVFVETFIYATAEKFLYEWEESEDYDVIFLDIRMGRMTGMDLAKIIRKTNNDIAIIFATNLKEYVLKGYSVSAMQYLLKPIKKEDCFECLNKVLNNRKEKKYYLLNDIEKTVKIPTSEIIYIEMFSHTATMVTASKKYEFRKTISQLLDELDDKLFIKCHKSFIINIRHVESVSKKFVIMSDNEEIPLSRDIADEINDMFIKYNMNKI